MSPLSPYTVVMVFAIGGIVVWAALFVITLVAVVAALWDRR